MADKPVNNAPEETGAAYSFYGRKDNTNNTFSQFPENEVAHAVGKTATAKGQMPYIDANGKIAWLATPANGDLVTWAAGIPATFTPSYITATSTNTLQNKSLEDATTWFVDNADATKKLQLQLSGITTATTRTLTVPNYDGTIATLAGTETFTNKSLQDSTTWFVDNSDATKKLQFELSGITTATTRTLTVQDVSGTIALLTDVAYDHLVTTNSASSQTTIDYTSSTITSSYDVVIFKIRKLYYGLTLTDTLLFRVSDNNGSSYISSGYDYQKQEIANTTQTNTSPTSQSEVTLMTQSFGSGGSGTAAYPGITGEVVVFTRPTSATSAGDTNNECTFFWRLYQWRSGSNQYFAQGSGRVSTSGRVNAVRFFNSAGGGAMNGVIEVFGVRNS